MFLFAPVQQPVLPVWSKKDVYFPVRRLLWASAAATVSLPEDQIFALDDGSHEKLALPFTPVQAQTVLAAAFAAPYAGGDEERLCDAIWGWSAGLRFTSEQNADYLQGKLALSFVKPVTATPRPTEVEAWIYRDNEKLLAQMTPTLDAQRELLAATAKAAGGIARGDVVVFACSPVFTAVAGQTLSSGVGGVGSVKITLQA